MKLPTFSVVMGNYNHAHYLPDTLQAIVDQSYPPMEVIVVDDASTDNSVEIIEGFTRKYPNVKLIRHEKNCGAGETEVHAMQYAKADFLISAAADDLVFPGLFEKSAKLLAQYPNAGICTSVTLTIDEHNNILGAIPMPPYITNSPSYLSPETVLKCLTKTHNWDIAGNTCFYRRDAFPEIKDYPTDANAFALLSLNFGACFIPEIYGAYRVLHNSFSAKRRSNPEAFQSDMEGFVKIMETAFSGEFPSEYIETYKKNIRYESANIYVNVLSSAQDDCVSCFQKSLHSDSFVDQVFIKSFKLWSKVQNFLLRRYLFFRLGRYSWAYFSRSFCRYSKKKNTFLSFPKGVKLP